MRAILASVLAGLVLGVCNSVSDTCMHPDAEFASSGPVDSHHLYAITVFLPFFFFFYIHYYGEQRSKFLLPGIFIHQHGVGRGGGTDN